MKSPTTTAELASAIESLVATYMDGVREAAEQALARGLVRQEVSRRPSKAQGARVVEAKSSSGRRGVSALDEACQALGDAVRARPGLSIVELAEQLGASAQELQLPMKKLRADGRVRTVGQRHLMRYFPAVARGSKE
jgi:hypothetical protein